MVSKLYKSDFCYGRLFSNVVNSDVNVDYGRGVFMNFEFGSLVGAVS